MQNFEHTKVEPNRLAATAANIESTISILGNAFKAVDETLRGSLQPSWHGDASNIFFAQYDMDAQTFASHVNALIGVNTRLKEASGIYDKADSKAIELVGNLRA